MSRFNFLLTLMFSRFEGDKLSLNDISNDLSNKFECNITKQSIDERFNSNSVGFLKMVIAKAFSSKIGNKNKASFLDNFKAVKIQDSTSFQLPKSLAGHYGGCGGAASGSLARIQFEYDLKNMDKTTLELTSGSYQDVSFSQDNMLALAYFNDDSAKTVKYAEGPDTVDSSVSWVPYQWKEIEIKLDFQTQTYDMWYDGDLVCYCAAFRSTLNPTTSESVHIQSSSGYTWYDDISID